MTRSRLFVLTLSVALFAAACASTAPEPEADVAAGPTTEPSRTKAGVKKGGKKETPALTWAGPDFEVATFDGETFQLAAQAGRPVVLNFWESW